jgi:hypothetical protein
MHFLKIVIGLIVLVFGRKIFWLSVAIMGFLVGMEFSSMLLADQPTWVMFLVGLGVGLLGALLATLFQRVAFAFAGFFAGAYLALMVAHPLGIGGNSVLLPIVGGVIGAIVAALLMDWAIIVLSCLVGAGVVVHQLHLGNAKGAIVFVVLVIIGILIQAKLIERSEEI